MHNFERKSRYQALTETQRLALGGGKELLPQSPTHEANCKKVDNYLNLTGKMPPRDTALGRWWHNNYQTTLRYNKRTKVQRERPDAIAARASKMQKTTNTKKTS